MELRTVNRAAIVVKPKQPFIDWANHFNNGGPTLTVESAREDPNVFLVDELDNDSEKQKIILKYYTMIFQHELEAWITDRDSWPSQLDLRTFRLWFDVHICSIVFDIAPDPLLQEQF